MLIVFEGIDRSGKSSLSVLFQEYLNNSHRTPEGLLKTDPHLGDFVWTKEPTFTTEEADHLNSPEFKNEFKRELLFFTSRIRHQNFMAGKNIICDRYIWSGLAYAKMFSPNCYNFAKELYLSEELFMQPDLQIFVDTPVEICYGRAEELGEELNKDNLIKLRDSFLETMKLFKTPIIIMESVGSFDKVLEELKERIEPYLNKENEYFL